MNIKTVKNFLFFNVLPLIAYLVVKLVCRTYRVRITGVTHRELKRYRYGHNSIQCTWHQRMFFFFHYFGRFHGDHGPVMMVSTSKDGEFADKAARLFGFASVRGSSTFRGKEALNELIQRVKGGESAGMILDGPLGPAWVVKKGAVILAQETGVPIIPVVYSARRNYLLKSWDRFMVPYPFTQVTIIFSRLIYVPPHIDEEGIESCRRHLEETLKEITIQADKIYGKPIVPDPKAGRKLKKTP